MIGYLAAIGAALSFGAGDFLGGVVSRRTTALSVATGVQILGAVVLIPLAIFVERAAWSISAVSIGIAVGAAFAVGLLALYSALALGAMGIATAVTGAIAAGTTLAADAILKGSAPSVPQVAGVALVLIATVLAVPRGGKNVRSSWILAVTAGLAFGIGFELLGGAAAGARLSVLAIARVTASAVLCIVIAARRAPRPTFAPPVAFASLLDAVANALFVLAVATVPVGLATSVAAGVPPLITMSLARGFLSEALPPAGLAAIGLATAGIVLITIA